MRKLLVCGAHTSTFTPLIFRLRQGMKPAYLGEDAGDFSVSSNAFPNYAMSPDGQKAVVTDGSQSAGANFRYSTSAPTEQHVLPASATTTANFSGRINSCASSDTHFAVGGSSPYLYVFDWETKTLQSTNSTGLGTVLKIAFNSDGSRMAVLHQTTPYLRIFNTADWTFVNAGTASGGPGSSYDSGLYFTDDGRLVVGTANSPYLSTFDVSTGARLNAITATTSLNSVSGIFKHPDQNAIIWVGNNNSPSNKHIGVMDLSTYALTLPFVDPGVRITCATYDRVNRELIMIHNEMLGRYCSIIALDDPGTLRHPGDDINSQIRGDGFNLVVVERDVGRITGTVRDIDNNPAQRRVIAINRAGEYVSAATMSSASTGDYELFVENTGLHDVQFRISDGELLNDLFYARVEPEAV